MEDDSDIYSDLPLCNFDDEIEKLKASNKNLSIEIVHLQGELVKITKEKDEYQTRCATLTKNISSLLKTAQAEIQRKDRLIKELRTQITGVSFEKQSYRKRKAQKDLEASLIPENKRSANGFLEEQKTAPNDSFSSVSIVTKENGSTVNENKVISLCKNNNVDNSKQDASTNLSNTEIGLLRKNTHCLPPFGTVSCKTVYSQRMLNKLQSLSTSNGSSDVLPKTNNDKENHNNDNITNRNNFYKCSGMKLEASDNPKGIEDQKLVDIGMKGDDAASTFLVPEVSGINKLTNSTLSTDKKQTNIDGISSVNSKQLEALFGSPLKWTETSNETTAVPQLALNSPAVYEDSCSAHIENAKFTLDLNKASLSKPIRIHKSPVQKITPINKCAGIVVGQEVNENVIEKEVSISNEKKWVRAFENVCDKGIHKPKSVISVLKKDPSKFSSISVNIGKESSLDISPNFLFKSKYEDSVLGQFDDTTQFVSALTRIESKISPLNTPVKCSQTLSVNTCTSSSNQVNSNSIKKEIVSENLTSRPLTISSEITNTNTRPVSKGLSKDEKPINILQPRKTPRIVNYNKTKEIDKKTSVAETPTKVNRFAINEEFISKQEEKVLKKCFNHVKDPIAISISSKGKGKGCHSPKGKTLRPSPKGKQKNLSSISKVKKAKLSVSPKERKISSTNRSDEREIKDSEKIIDNSRNLLHTSREHSPVVPDQDVPNDRSNEIFEKSLSRLSVQENSSKLHGTSDKLSKQYWCTQENLPVKESVDKHQPKLLPGTSDKSTNLRRSREKQLHKLAESKLENSTNLSRCHEKLLPKLHENKEDSLKKSSQMYLSTSQQSNNKNSFNLPPSVEKNMPESYQSYLERPNLLKIHESFYNESSLENNLSRSLARSHETWHHQQQSRSFLISQEKTTKGHLCSEQCSSSTYLHQTPDRASSNCFQNPAEKQSKRNLLIRLPSPESKFNKRFEEKHLISTDEAKPNLFQDCKRKKFNVVPNTLEKRISRIQNFKPSSQLKKQADNIFLPKEKCYQTTEMNDHHESPKNCKSLGGSSFLVESPTMKIEKVQMTLDNHSKDSSKNLDKLPMIVRSSKKPEFASTTLSDDDYASKTPTKSAEHFKSKNCEIIEHMEWVLKPITFDFVNKSVKDQMNLVNQRTILTNKEISPSSDNSHPTGKPPIACNISESPKMQNRKTASFVSHSSQSQIKVMNSAPSPNKIIRARRPLNFGVSVVTH